MGPAELLHTPSDGRNSPASPVCHSGVDEDFAASLEAMDAALLTPRGAQPLSAQADGGPDPLDDPSQTPRSASPALSQFSWDAPPQPQPGSAGMQESYFTSRALLDGPDPAAPPSAASSASSSANASSSSIKALHSHVRRASSRPPSISLSQSGESHSPAAAATADHHVTSFLPLTAPAPATADQLDRRNYPVYPNQAFSVLHTQVYPPPYLPRPLRTRSSHPSQYASFAAAPISRQRSHDDGSPEPGSKTAGHTPASSPGLFAPPATPSTTPSIPADPAIYSSSFLHWTQQQRPKETHVADKDIDPVSGRKLLNQYEIIDELGRGVHGKVKLGRNLEKGVEVAIKIVARYSKRRRLGKLGNPEDKVKKEVAILKKAIHPNVVALLEVIDDPAIMKVYIVLEYVELGEIVWRTKGSRDVVLHERRRAERAARGEPDEPLAPAAAKQTQGAHVRLRPSAAADFWSLEYGDDVIEEEGPAQEATSGRPGSGRLGSTAAADDHPPSSLSDAVQHHGRLDGNETGNVPHGAPSASPVRSHSSLPALSAASTSSDRPPSSHGNDHSTAADIFSLGMPSAAYDPFEEDYSYVPCLTIEQARQTFRDTVLGLEYLHYQGIIHRDIKPANLLWTADHRVKISDFGVSYLGRPIRDDDTIEDLSEADARPLDEAVELAKTVGTPAFYAPELCYTDLTAARPPVTGQIDLWALGVTLYGLVFARLPFLAEDEFSLFKSISEDEVSIPLTRLKAVDPHVSSRSTSHSRLPTLPNEELRREDELVYEDIDEDLRDLLKRILEKDPTKRITLKEVKRHPFTLHGIADPIRWIDETDPTRQNEGRKIEVSNEDVEKAVVSIGFLERVRSGMRKVGQAIGFGKAREGRRRIRGSGSTSTSNAEDSGDSVSPTPTLRDRTRSSPRDEDSPYSGTRSAREGEHPLSQSVTASPDPSDAKPFFQDPVATGSPRAASATVAALGRPNAPERAISTSAASTRTIVPYRSGENERVPTPLRSPGLLGATAVESLGGSNLGGIFGGAGNRPLRSTPSSELSDLGESSASRSGTPPIDRVAYGLEEPRVEPSVALSTTTASGRVDQPSSPGPSAHESPAASQGSPALHSPALVNSYLGGTSDTRQAPTATSSPDRPATAPAEGVASTTGNPSALGSRPTTHESAADSFARAQDQLSSQRRPEVERFQSLAAEVGQEAGVPGPPSPDDEIFFRRQHDEDGRQQAAQRSGSSDLNLHPVASPPSMPMISSSSEDHLASGMSQSTSYPSVPSVVSAGSSVSTDDAATCLAKEEAVLPLLRTDDTVRDAEAAARHDEGGGLASDDDAGYNGDHGGDDEEDSDDDDFLVMSRLKSQHHLGRRSDASGEMSSMTPRSTRSGSTGTVRKKASDGGGPEEVGGAVNGGLT
ncbi:MAG: hypothetical protein M1832_000127 [Thelocarpon impressellum]|nr:MAG: hypothetical protein M1832_000127 [Thelocarpon impressellum]